MAWFKVDDGFYSSSKVMSIPRAQRLSAVGLWLMCGNWSARQLSDGVVPGYVLVELGATPKLRQALITARLWLDQGLTKAPSSLDRIEFHDWAHYQPTRAQVEEAREKERIRKDKYRLSHRDTEGTPASVPLVSQGVSQGVSEHPDPTRPDPTLKEKVIEGGGSNTSAAPTPFCPKHPEGTDRPCRACQTARIAFERPAPTVPGIITDADCDKHPGRPARGCDRCAEEVAS